MDNNNKLLSKISIPPQVPQHDSLDISAFESQQFQFKDNLCTARSETERLRATLDTVNTKLNQLTKNVEEVKVLHDSIEQDINNSIRKRNLLENTFKANSDSKGCSLEQELVVSENEKLKELVRVLEMENNELVRQIQEVENQSGVLSEEDLSKTKTTIDSLVEEKEVFAKRILADSPGKISEITKDLDLSKNTIKTVRYYANKLKSVKEEMTVIENQVHVTDSIAIVYKSMLGAKNHASGVSNNNFEVFGNLELLGLHLDEQVTNQYDVIAALSTDLSDVRKKITDMLIMQETPEEPCYDLWSNLNRLDKTTQTECDAKNQIVVNTHEMIKKEPLEQ